MQIELIIFGAMLAVFIVGCFLFKLPVSVAMVLASVTGTLVGGRGIPIRHLVEGTFGYIDTILVIATAMIFMKVIQESGALNALSASIIERFHKRPAISLIFLMIIVMFPGMITGSSTASVLSAGSIIAPIFILMGIPKLEAGAIIAIGGILGMIAPPVNIPAMIIGGGIDIPYVGFTIPLLLLTIPVAIFTVLFLGYKYVKELNYEEVKKNISLVEKEKYGFKLYIPIFVVLILMVGTKALPRVFPDLGMPLIFIIGAVSGLFTGNKINPLKVGKDAVKTSLPVLGILMGVGMFIQVMTLTGVRGFIVINCLSLPSVLLYLAIAVAIPLFGAVSSFGAASVLGVPFLLALLGKNEIVTASALSFIASLGDLMPPTALAGIFAAQVVGEENYTKVLKKCAVPALVIIVYGLLFIVFAKQIAGFIY
ncbi:TRAP-type C4-dicarboxylate transport system permease large subunit [Clostridium pascui]|uniref:TRAP transporter large permease subunit n=1 Tax=Clostridium pascui TaxID=46609 RepID=UPI00195CFDE5|nr:TRAP transporter large permease subunit [Clostridium pascui]MBM7870682.1 TRAP-type C4-dicarboxylate transport system permease large subunit [Clostridium pascui]